MNRGVIFFIVIVLVVLAIIFIPKNKDNAPAVDQTTDEMSQDLQGSAVEALPDLGASTETTVETGTTTEAGAEGVVEVPATETTPEVTQ